MLRDFLRRILSLGLSAVLLLALLPAISVPARAATQGTLPLSDTGLGASYSGSDDGTYTSWEVDGNNVTGMATSKDGGTCGSDTKYKTTLTLRNNKSMQATLSFDYTVTLAEGKITVAGSPVTSGSSYSGKLEPNESIEIYLESGSPTSATLIKITNLRLITDTIPTITFQPATGGSYTVDGEEITATTEKSKPSKEAYTLKASPAEDYKFMGWYSVTNSGYLSTETETSLYFDSDQTITALFAPKAAPIFTVGALRSNDLNEASDYASENGIGKIMLASSGTLPAGEYTVHAGVTLVIPFDEEGTYYTEDPGGPASSSYTKPGSTAFRQLTLADGAHITVENGGSINVSAQQSAVAGTAGTKSATTGQYGRLELQGGSSVTVESGGTFYSYGYTTGEGTIIGENGAVLHELFELTEFRGGTATLGMISGDVFPLSQYYVQNIEAPMTLEAGAYLYTHAAVYASYMRTSASVLLIGPNDADAMFKLKNGTIIKRYLPESDRCQVDVNGDMEIAKATLDLGIASIDSSSYVLPINGQFIINIKSGTTAITENVELLPGVNMTVDQGAELAIDKSLYLYDSEEWVGKKYVFGNKDLVAASFSPTRTYTRGDEALTDVRLDVNGTVTVQGKLITTEGGADIVSTQGVGKITFETEASTEGIELQQVTQAGSAVTFCDIPITSAKLHNGKQYTGTDEEYTATDSAPAGTTYAYCTDCGKWYTGKHYQVTFHVDGEEQKTVCSAGGDVTYDSLKSAPLKVTDGEGTVLNPDTDYTYAEAEGTLTILEVQRDMDVYVYTITVARIVTGGSSEASVAYASLADALKDYVAGDEKKVYIQMDKDETIAEALTIEKDVYLDLNGHTVTLEGGLTITAGHTLYGMDCATDAFTDKNAGKIVGTVNGTVAKAHESYCTADGSRVRYVTDTRMKGELSFHRYNMSVTRYQFHFRSEGDCDMVFGATFRGSQTVAELLMDMGFLVSRTETDKQSEGWWTTDNITENAPLPPENVLANPNGYIIQGTLINIGAGGDSSEFTANYSITALLKFDAKTQMESVARVLNYLEALKSYYKSDEATDEQKVIIDTFITGHGLTDAWNSSSGVEGAHPGDPSEQAG